MNDYSGAFHAIGVTSAAEARLLARAGYHSDPEVLAAADADLEAVVGVEAVQRIRGRSGTSDLPLTGPQRGALKQAGLVTADDLRAASDDDLLAIEGIGDRTLQAIRDTVGGDTDGISEAATED